MADIMTIEEMPILLRREVEARILKPFLEEMEKELGKDKTKEIVIKIIRETARAEGAKKAVDFGSNKLEDLPEINGHHVEGNSLDMEYTKLAENQLMMKTLRCEYVDMYDRLGMKEWGCLLSCLRDEEFYIGLNPDFKFKRTQVLMTGGTCCDSLVIDKKGE